MERQNIFSKTFFPLGVVVEPRNPVSFCVPGIHCVWDTRSADTHVGTILL